MVSERKIIKYAAEFRIHRLHLCKGVRSLPNKYPGFETKSLHGKAPIRELWRMYTSSSCHDLPVRGGSGDIPNPCRGKQPLWCYQLGRKKNFTGRHSSANTTGKNNRFNITQQNEWYLQLICRLLFTVVLELVLILLVSCELSFFFPRRWFP